MTLLRVMLHDLRLGWRPLFLTHLLYSLLTVVLLAPLVSLSIGALVALSGEVALTDEAILRFALHPLGLLALVLGAALLMSLVALRYGALMSIGLWLRHGRQPRTLPALWSALGRAPTVLRVAGRMVFWTLLRGAPFFIVGVLLVSLLLGRYDINFYLSQRPPVFWLTAVLLGLLGLGLAWVWLRLFVGWVYALPLALFTDRGPTRVLRLSGRLARQQRVFIVLCLLAWFAFSSLVTGLLLGFTDTLGEWVIPLAGDSLLWLAPLLVAVALVGGALGLVAGFVNSSVLSLLVVRLADVRLAGGLTPPPLSDVEPGVTLSQRWISLRGVLRGGVVVGVLAIIGGILVLERVNLSDRSQIIAHRGASVAAPENTLAAVQQAIDEGAHWVEIDVQETADGEVVVFHDRDFKKLAGVGQALHETTLEELQHIDIGSWLDPRFSDQRVPTLDTVLALARDRIGVLIELKYYGFQQRLEERVVAAVEAAGMVDQVQIMSLKPEGVAKIRALRPDWPVGLLSSVAVGDALRLDVDFLAVNARFISPGLIRRAHRRDKRIMAWTVNDPLGMSELMSQGVDGVITDLPALGMQVLAERAELNPAERLLLRAAAWSGREPHYAPQ